MPDPPGGYEWVVSTSRGGGIYLDLKDEEQTRYDCRSVHVPGYRVLERRPFRWFDREWRCSHCNKKDVTYPWFTPRNYTGDWEEFRRWEVKGK